MNLESSILPEFDRETARTRRILEAVPADRMHWKAGDSFHDISWNANHLVELVGWTAAVLEDSEMDIAPVDGPKYETPNENDPQKLLEIFDQNVKSSRDALANVSPSALTEPWSLKQAGQTLFTIEKGECVRTWVINHMIHHRAILSVMLRMAGVELTPAYDG